MCRSALSNNQLHPDCAADLFFFTDFNTKLNPDAVITSDYNTQESKSAEGAGKGKQKSSRAKLETPECELKWWHLIEPIDIEQPDRLQSRFQARILRLCSNLAKTIR